MLVSKLLHIQTLIWQYSGGHGLEIKDRTGVSSQNKCFISLYFQKTTKKNSHTALFHYI